MLRTKIILLILTLSLAQIKVDICSSNQSYATCIQSTLSKCLWEEDKQQCSYTSDYLMGCHPGLNAEACISQIGDSFNQMAQCRFIQNCQEIPDPMVEQCSNKLNKYGCLSVINQQEICYWKDGGCRTLKQDDWSQIQENFENYLYSVSACSHITHFLIIHNTLLWDLLNYTPNLMEDAEAIYLNDLGIETKEVIVYDDPNSVFLQNNYLMKNGTFVWYRAKQTKSITLTNLKISNRQREGCIALEIQNDSDYEVIFSLKENFRGVNHIYCQYLNQNLQSEPFYVFSQGTCKLFQKENLQNQNQLAKFEITCESLNWLYCIYITPSNNYCKIQAENLEYQCLASQDSKCDDNYCSISNCQQKGDHYLDRSTNLCTNFCYVQYSQYSCEQYSDCVYLGFQNVENQIICSPLQLCDSKAISFNTCRYLKANCQWDTKKNLCFTLDNEQIQQLNCENAINLYVCTQVAKSDQMCSWNQEKEKCLNVLDQPILLTFSYFLDFSEMVDFDVYVQYSITNLNLCKYNTNFYTNYNFEERRCYFTPTETNQDNQFKSKFDCLNSTKGFWFWNQKFQICESVTDLKLSKTQCLELFDVNEISCQFAQVSNIDKICYFNQYEYTCQEIELANLEQIECDEYGLSQKICIMKPFCRYQGKTCEKLSLDYINSINCSAFRNVNFQVCSNHNRDTQLCDFSELDQSCYMPNQYGDIKFKISLNRFSCARVTDYATYYDFIDNQCTIITKEMEQFIIFNSCDGYYLSKMACQNSKILQMDCQWDSENFKCVELTFEFTYCSDYNSSGASICAALERNPSQVLLKANFCSFQNNSCNQSIEILSDCGDDEIMNVHRCSGLTGVDSQSNPIKMCAFYNQKCISLNKEDVNTLIILQQLNCEQANQATCKHVATAGQICHFENQVSKNEAILERKCSGKILFQEFGCLDLQKNYSIEIINTNFCAQANDACYYEQNIGCAKPIHQNFDCDSSGLSAQACFNNTQNKRCAFINNQCQYLSEEAYKVQCSQLNNYLCLNFQYLQCIWIDNQCEEDEDTQNITKFTCSRNIEKQLQIYDGEKCIHIEKNQLDDLYCQSYGLNQFTCLSVPSQYCIFINNECQIYRNILCQDTENDCSENNTRNQSCVQKDGKCSEAAEFPTKNCDSFERTNYEYCYQFTQCVYSNGICLQRTKKNQGCDQFYTGIDCTFHSNYECIYNDSENYCERADFRHCPIFEGYFSFWVCYFNGCNSGYTKSGLGFCYKGDIQQITCEQLPYKFCVDDLSHLNSKLNCYFDGQCKTLEDFNQNCEFLSQFPSNYSACKLIPNDEECLYSHADHFCKPFKQYSNTICKGTTLVQCSLIQNICYFDGENCVQNGQGDQLNKYGCTQQDGFWQFKNFQCINLSEDSILESCFLVSKKACLSQMTKELRCRWMNNQCQPVFQEEGKLINECQNLNERVCLSVRLSNFICFWDSEQNECKNIIIDQTECNFIADNQNISFGMCGSQQGKPCVKVGQKCSELTIDINSCLQYGLNKLGCILKTTDVCYWKEIGDGGYCEQANILLAECDQNLNKNACQRIKTQGQFCFWNDSEGKCEFKEKISTCESASFLNSQLPCLSVQNSLCEYNYITHQCKQITHQLAGCRNNYNKFACEYNFQPCSWSSNQCVFSNAQSCKEYPNRSQCLNTRYSCQWTQDKCENYSYSTSVYCQQLPKNVSNGVCSKASIQFCYYDQHKDSCYPDLEKLNQVGFIFLNDLLAKQGDDFVSPILSGECQELDTLNDCIRSRKKNQLCVWEDECKVIDDQNEIKCNQNLNIYGCLAVTMKNQFCMWQGKCFDWDQKFIWQSNVNSNVCKKFSVNKVYSNYSCVSRNIGEITCDDLGISKETCLSITKYQCMWSDTLDICLKFEYKNQQKCEDYQQVSPYVCQMQITDSCIHNNQTKNCQQSLIQSISMLGCLSNQKETVFWDGQECQILNQNISCDQQLKVNSLSCQITIDLPCIYDRRQSSCSSFFNIQALRCSTQGLNLLGCVKVQSEPCIFQNGNCEQFSDFYSSCNSLKNVNAKVCASISSEKCEYSELFNKCQSPQISNSLCNVEGINNLMCQSNDLCQWNSDYRNCECKDLNFSEYCFTQSPHDCNSNKFCIFDDKQCKLKQCYNLKDEECENQILASSICYLTQSEGCQPAKQCEDIINPKVQCSTFYVNNHNCIQYQNSCISYNNYSLVCPQSDCLLSQCILENGSCRKKICADYMFSDCNNQDGCYLNQDKKCEELKSCLVITGQLFQENAGSICNQLSVNNRKCNWQQRSVFLQNQICTNNYCSIFGTSVSLCQGNEINSVSCVLSRLYQCISCEEIVEECFCNKQVNTCQFINGKCKSVLCSSLATAENCQLASSRCLWSTEIANGSCVRICEKIYDQSECLELKGQCYFDQSVGYCKQGQRKIANLSLNITVETIASKILIVLISILLQFQ